MEEIRISESHLIIVVPDRFITEIVSKTTDLGHWVLKRKIHKKLVSNLLECFNDIKLFYNYKYAIDNTLIINLNYINNQYLFEIINMGDTLSDDESYVALSIYHTLGIEYI
jgi:hypothetical protein